MPRHCSRATRCWWPAGSTPPHSRPAAVSPCCPSRLKRCRGDRDRSMPIRNSAAKNRSAGEGTGRSQIQDSRSRAQPVYGAGSLGVLPALNKGLTHADLEIVTRCEKDSRQSKSNAGLNDAPGRRQEGELGRPARSGPTLNPNDSGIIAACFGPRPGMSPNFRCNGRRILSPL